MTVSSRKATKTTQVTVNETKSAVRFAEKDDSFPYRLVGSYEYGEALKFLGELVESSTSDQITVYDKLIAQNPEFSFYSGIASNFGLQPDFASMSSEEHAEIDENFLRSSLAWMMALARVELGATAAMYGDQDDPFGVPVAIGGGEFGAKEYLQILVDDLAAHLKAASTDGNYHRALNPRKKVDNQSLAFLRRTQLIDALLSKVLSSGNAEVVSLATPYKKRAEDYVETMIKKIWYATISFSLSTEGTQTRRISESTITGVRFVNRQNLLACQQGLEQSFPPPRPEVSPLE